jgi:hypothetical protein
VIKKIIHLILVTMLASAAMAQDVSVRSDHPDEYTVVKGDTLWDISGKLVYIDGRARLQVNGDKKTVRMSPDARVLDREPIPPIEWDAIKNFVINARILPAGDYSGLPYVVANESSRHMATTKDLTYVRGLDGRIGEEYAIVRLRHIYYDDNGVMKRGKKPPYPTHIKKGLEYPDTIWNATLSWRKKNPPVLGYEYWDVAKGRLVKPGDPATLEIEGGRAEVRAGDLILPLDKHEYASHMLPHAMNPTPEGLEVVALTQTTYGSGHYQLIAINAGSNQGVEPGHVFSAFRAGKTVRDEVKYPKGSWEDAKTWNGDKVTLPDQYSAHVLVFRVFDEVSYAMIMDGDRPVREHDLLKHPDETL